MGHVIHTLKRHGWNWCAHARGGGGVIFFADSCGDHYPRPTHEITFARAYRYGSPGSYLSAFDCRNFPCGFPREILRHFAVSSHTARIWTSTAFSEPAWHDSSDS